MSRLKFDGLVKGHSPCHCEERSDEAIFQFQLLVAHEIASRSLSRLSGLAMTKRKTVRDFVKFKAKLFLVNIRNGARPPDSYIFTFSATSFNSS